MDREKVIKGLEQIVNDPFMKARADYWVLVCSEAIAMLKEQENEISRITNEYLNLVKVASKKPEIIRCKDCKHRPKEPDWETYEDGGDIEFPDGKCPCQCSSDRYYSWYPDDDWFCAEGERK